MNVLTPHAYRPTHHMAAPSGTNPFLREETSTQPRSDGYSGTCLIGDDAPVSPAPSIAPATEAEISQAATANNKFTLALHQSLASSEKGNFFCSPFNVNGAMSMVLAGAAGETATAIANGLAHDELQGERIHAGVGAMNDSVDGEFDGVKISISNRVFPQKGAGVKEGFKTITGELYGVEPETMDYRADADGARQYINGLVAEDTNDRIQDLLPSGSVNAATKMILTSAIHFKADWKGKFDADLTREVPFYPGEGAEPTTVEMMHQTADYKFGKFSFAGERVWDGDGDVKVIEMPYQDERFSMVALLPSEVSGGMAALEQNLTPENLEKWTSQNYEQEVNLAFPKFKMDSDFNLTGSLSNMGMGEAFGGRADFSNMMYEDTAISGVVHKAFVEVNEEGTEFAAATGVVFESTSISRPEEFKADKPFMFFVKDNETGALLCSGRFSEPS